MSDGFNSKGWRRDGAAITLTSGVQLCVMRSPRRFMRPGRLTFMVHNADNTIHKALAANGVPVVRRLHAID